jgi:hypothetical protein
MNLVLVEVERNIRGVMELKLQLELIPEGQWGKSLARLLPKSVWDMLRRDVYQKFNYSCCICGATNCRVNCHESWRFDDKKRIQYLMYLQCLCDDCHMIRHWGRTVAVTLTGELPVDTITRLTKHFCEVNQCTVQDFEVHKVLMGNLWQERSRHPYKVDFGLFAPEVVVKKWANLKK